VLRGALFFPENRATPIAAEVAMETATGAPVSLELDWRQTGPQTWDIAVETDAGALLLAKGGAELTIDGAPRLAAADTEYARLYARFAELTAAGRSDVDLAPLTLVADAFLVGRRQSVEPFLEEG
jgi:D-galactose 1-dehydrogenase